MEITLLNSQQCAKVDAHNYEWINKVDWWDRDGYAVHYLNGKDASGGGSIDALRRHGT